MFDLRAGPSWPVPGEGALGMEISQPQERIG